MDPWEVLDTPRSAGVAAAKSAWRELVALYHPDHHADMPEGVQRRAAAGLRRVNEAWASIKADAARKSEPAPTLVLPDFIEGGGLRVPYDAAGDGVFFVEGPVFDAKRRIKQAVKAAGLSMKVSVYNTIVIDRGSFSSKDRVVVDLVDQGTETECTVTDGSTNLQNLMFDALRAATIA